MQITDLEYMTTALTLAKRGQLTVSPNPMVGCVIVNNDRVVGQGFHQRAGEPHAEIYALREAGASAEGATAYVSLEPCCHYNRTPPCTDALIKAGIKKIYVACLDPNPRVAGKGVAALQAAGIEVEVGLCQTEALQLNEVFFHYIRHKRPFVIAKWAMSLDGKTITTSGDTKDISCPGSRAATHVTRQEVDAILVGANTAIEDDPLLTVRLKSTSEPISKNPIRIILSSHGKLPFYLKMFDPSMPAQTIVATTPDIDKTLYDEFTNKNIEVIVLPKNEQGQVDLPSLLDELGKREITSLLVEGGMATHESFFRSNLVNKINVYLAPVIIGTLEKKHLITNMNASSLDRDFYFTANYKEDVCLPE